MKDLRYALIGTSNFAKAIFDELIHQGFNIVAIISQPDKPVGRKKVLTAPETAQLAKAYQIPLFQPVSIKNDHQFFLDLEIDVLICASYGQIIPVAVLDACRIGAINVHGSLLPALRGASPIQTALLQGLEETGVTIMQMVKAMDAGAIYSQETIKIAINDDFYSLEAKMIEVGTRLLIATLPAITKGVHGVPQVDEQATFCRLLTYQDGQLDFQQDAFSNYHKIRALCKWPVAHFSFNEKEVKVFSAALVDQSGPAGTVIAVTKDGPVVACKSGALVLKSVQLSGGKVMSGSAFANGHHLLGKQL